MDQSKEDITVVPEGETNGHPTLTEEQEESEAIRKEFQKYFDLEVVFENVDKTFETVRASLEKLTAETQWVPRNWVYS